MGERDSDTASREEGRQRVERQSKLVALLVFCSRESGIFGDVPVKCCLLLPVAHQFWIVRDWFQLVPKLATASRKLYTK